jgi:hypothetical protein
MPNTLALYPKGSKEPHSFVRIDESMCEHFGHKPHPTRYLCAWVDSIAFFLAIGKSWDDIRGLYTRDLERARTDPEMDGDEDFCSSTLAILEWLEANYSFSAGYEMK